MYGKVCALFSWVRSKFVAAFAFVGAFICAASAWAEGPTLEIEPPEIPWTEIPTKIMTALSTPLIVGLGIGLSIWVIFMGLGFFRRTSKS